VKVRGNVRDSFDTYGRRQNIVQRLDEIRACDRRTGLEMGDLVRRVHTRVGAARRENVRHFARYLLECLFKARLDGRSVPLPLPAVKVRSVIGEN
jgi:hypothetical protein